MSLKQFPFDRLQIRDAFISSSLSYNLGYPPKVRWGICVETEPLELGEDAANPDFETKIESAILLDELELNISDWRELVDRFEFDDRQNGTYYVSSAHNPADLEWLELEPKGGNEFHVTAYAKFDFEFEGAGYRNQTVKLQFPATYEGFRFRVPSWTDPDNQVMPPEFGIPSMDPEWPDSMILEFVARFVDLSQYEDPVLDSGRGLELRPKGVRARGRQHP